MTLVLVVEDERDLAAGLASNLEIEGHAVEVAASGAAALAAIRRGAPDLVLLDLMLPDQDGFRVLRELRAAGCVAPVLVLTARGEEADKVRALRLGADDYVCKPFGLLELLARVEALLRRARGGAGGPAALRFGDVEVRPAERLVLRRGEPVALAPREYELLAALLEAGGAVVSRGELLRRVWRYPASLVTRTVDTHVGELRRKLEADPAAPRHLLTVRKAGYRLARD